MTPDAPTRPVAGRARYPGGPLEVGTIVGPTMVTREYLAAIAVDDRGRTVFGYATAPEIAAARARLAAGGAPRSIAERYLGGG